MLTGACARGCCGSSPLLHLRYTGSSCEQLSLFFAFSCTPITWKESALERHFACRTQPLEVSFLSLSWFFHIQLLFLHFITVRVSLETSAMKSLCVLAVELSRVFREPLALIGCFCGACQCKSLDASCQHQLGLRPSAVRWVLWSQGLFWLKWVHPVMGEPRCWLCHCALRLGGNGLEGGCCRRLVWRCTWWSR